MDFKKIFYNQISIDYNTSIEDIESKENLYTVNKRQFGRSRYEWDDTALLKICVLNNKFIMCSYDEALLKRLKDEFDNINPGFLGSFHHLELLNNILRDYNEKICDIHHYYLPFEER